MVSGLAAQPAKGSIGSDQHQKAEEASRGNRQRYRHDTEAPPDSRTIGNVDTMTAQGAIERPWAKHERAHHGKHQADGDSGKGPGSQYSRAVRGLVGHAMMLQKLLAEEPDQGKQGSHKDQAANQGNQAIEHGNILLRVNQSGNTGSGRHSNPGLANR